jgi:hypothetical protein
MPKKTRDIFWNYRFQIALVAFFYSAIAISTRLSGWTRTWEFLGVPSMYPEFADLRSVQAGISALSMGLNPQLTNPTDPWNRTMNYPLIWVIFASKISLSNELIFLIFCYIVNALSILVFFLIMKKSKTLFSVFIFSSGAVLLILERGNNDLIVFLLLFASIYQSRIKTKIILIFCIILKLYPLFSLPFMKLFVREKVFVAFFGIIYIFVIRNQIPSILKGNTAAGSLSYGFLVPVEQYSNILNQNLEISFPFSLILSIHMTIVVLCVVLSRNFLSPHRFVDFDSEHAKLFFIGAGVYCSTFVFGRNWDYRLIFLTLCIPWISKQSKVVKNLILTLFLISMNYLLIAKVLSPKIAMPICDFSKSIIFSILVYLLIRLYKEGRRVSN